MALKTDRDITDALRKKARELVYSDDKKTRIRRCNKLAEAMFQAAEAGNVKAAAFIANRLEGLPKQRVEGDMNIISRSLNEWLVWMRDPEILRAMQPKTGELQHNASVPMLIDATTTNDRYEHERG